MAKVRRQVPHPDEIFELLKFKKPDLNLKHARLEKAQTIEDLRKIAKRRTPSAAFDYTDGAADDEISMNRARQAFKDVEFHPSILNDVTNLDTSCEIFGGLRTSFRHRTNGLHSSDANRRRTGRCFSRRQGRDSLLPFHPRHHLY